MLVRTVKRLRVSWLGQILRSSQDDNVGEGMSEGKWMTDDNGRESHPVSVIPASSWQGSI